MHLTTKHCFAVTAMLDVGICEQSGPVSLLQISERRRISQSYLEQIFSKLRQAELVKSSRGPGGGYVLNKSPENITIAEIVNAMDARILGKPPCAKLCELDSCLLENLWNNVGEKINDYLITVKLSALLEEHHLLCNPEICKHDKCRRAIRNLEKPLVDKSINA